MLFGGHGFDLNYLCAQLCGGGLMLGAFFMATDYVTRPITAKGQYVFGIILGLWTGIFRIFGPGTEGVSYAIIIGNLLVPLIEKATMPVAFGKVSPMKQKRMDAKTKREEKRAAKLAAMEETAPDEEEGGQENEE